MLFTEHLLCTGAGEVGCQQSSTEVGPEPTRRSGLPQVLTLAAGSVSYLLTLGIESEDAPWGEALTHTSWECPTA